MSTNDREKAIRLARICPYCGAKPVYTDSSVVYRKSYGMIYLCIPCNAFVGVHEGTDKPLGRLANAELRLWKKRAHAVFDVLWKHKEACGTPHHKARQAAYKWLSKELGLPPQHTHIGMFDVGLCKKVVALCSHKANIILNLN